MRTTWTAAPREPNIEKDAIPRWGSWNIKDHNRRWDWHLIDEIVFVVSQMLTSIPMGMAFSSRSSSSTLKQTISTHITCNKKKGPAEFSIQQTVVAPLAKCGGEMARRWSGWVPSARGAPAWPAGNPGSSATGRLSSAFLPGGTTAVRTPECCDRGRDANRLPGASYPERCACFEPFGTPFAWLPCSAWPSRTSARLRTNNSEIGEKKKKSLSYSRWSCKRGKLSVLMKMRLPLSFLKSESSSNIVQLSVSSTSSNSYSEQTKINE